MSVAEPEIEYSEGVALPPSVRPLIVVTGSNYDMGYQWYRQIVQIYGKQPLMRRANKEFTDEELNSLKAYQSYIKSHTPEMITMLKGMAAGAKDAGIPLSYQEVLAKWSSTKSYSNAPSGSEDAELPPKHDCSGFAVWGSTTTDGQLIASGNGDHQLYWDRNRIDEEEGNEIQNFEYTVALFPEEGNNFIVPTSTGCCWHGNMNNKGVVNWHHGATGYCGRFGAPQEYGYGVPNTMITMHALRFAESAAEAKDIVLSLPSPDGRVGGGWADTTGNAFVIENRNSPRVIREPGDVGERDFIYATNNLLSKELGHCMDEREGEKVYVPHAGWHNMRDFAVSSVDRNLGMWNMFHNYHSNIDFDFVKMMRRFSGKPPAYDTLEEAIEQSGPTWGEGWAQTIATQANAMVAIMVPDDGDEGRYLISNGCPAKSAYPSTAGSAYYQIEETNSFYELKVTSNIKQFAKATTEEARYRIIYADWELDKLNYHDPAYAPLYEIFKDVQRNWFKGEHYFNLAQHTTGNESVLNWAKAMRYHNRCQAFANKIYNELVPPATCPEDIGLRPYRHPGWGEWANE